MSLDFIWLAIIVNTVVLVPVFIILFCFICQYCPVYKYCKQRTAYQRLNQNSVNAQSQSANPGPNTVNIQGAYPIQPGLSAFTTHPYYPAVPCQNAAGFPVTQPITVSGLIKPVPYAMPPTVYPSQQTVPGGYVMPASAPPSMTPPHTGAMLMPMGQPPPYSEVVQMQSASGGGNAPEAYTKQAAYNPYFNQNGP